jgi:hypothetical protein
VIFVHEAYRSIIQITIIPKFPHLNSLISGASDSISDAIPPNTVIHVPTTTIFPTLEYPVNQVNAEQTTARNIDADGPAKRIQACASIEGWKGSFTCAEQAVVGHCKNGQSALSQTPHATLPIKFLFEKIDLKG